MSLAKCNESLDQAPEGHLLYKILHHHVDTLVLADSAEPAALSLELRPSHIWCYGDAVLEINHEVAVASLHSSLQPTRSHWGLFFRCCCCSLLLFIQPCKGLLQVSCHVPRCLLRLELLGIDSLEVDPDFSLKSVLVELVVPLRQCLHQLDIGNNFLFGLVNDLTHHPVAHRSPPPCLAPASCPRSAPSCRKDPRLSSSSC